MRIVGTIFEMRTVPKVKSDSLASQWQTATVPCTQWMCVRNVPIMGLPSMIHNMRFGTRDGDELLGC